MSMRFEWDPKKAEKNLKKHGVTFQEATTVYYRYYLFEREDCHVQDAIT